MLLAHMISFDFALHGSFSRDTSHETGTTVPLSTRAVHLSECSPANSHDKLNMRGHVFRGSLRFERVEEIFNFTFYDCDVLECASVFFVAV